MLQALTIIPIFNRSFLLGVVVAILYIFSIYYKPTITLKQKLAIAFLGIGLFVGLFFYRAASSNGRLLIYKITFSQLTANDYIMGLGIGKFKAKYNLLQAQYYTTHNINSNESQLADNVSYLFNDWLQALLEIGLVGSFLLVIIIFLFSKIFIRKKINLKQHKILLVTNAILITIIVAALFNYPLQSIFIFVPFILLVTLHFYYSYALHQQYNFKKLRLLKNTILIITTTVALFYALIIYNYKLKTKEAITLSQSGYKMEALAIFTNLEKYPFKDYEASFQQAYLLYQINKPTQALQKLTESEQLNISDATYKLKADIHDELGNYTEAEKNYLLVVYMIPNRMQSKFNLMQFYIRTNQKTKAMYWANNILTMKVKVPSPTIYEIRRNTKLILEKL
jgi:tetratricopeptide (TPR) repeat protein